MKFTRIYLVLIVFLFLSITNKCPKNKYLPFTRSLPFDLKDIIEKDTLILDVREFILSDTITNTVLIYNYGFNSDVRAEKGKIYINQYVVLRTKGNLNSEKEIKFYFSKYVISSFSEKYCIERVDDINYNDFLLRIRVDELDSNSVEKYYFLGCFGEDSERSYELFKKCDNMFSHEFDRQLFYQGITSHRRRYYNPTLLKKRKGVNDCVKSKSNLQNDTFDKK